MWVFSQPVFYWYCRYLISQSFTCLCGQTLTPQVSQVPEGMSLKTPPGYEKHTANMYMVFHNTDLNALYIRQNTITGSESIIQQPRITLSEIWVAFECQWWSGRCSCRGMRSWAPPGGVENLRGGVARLQSWRIDVCRWTVGRKLT